MKKDKDQLTGKGVSRRSILKGAVVMGAAAMSGGLALNMAAPGTAEAMVKKLPQKWDETWDVVIIGSGFAGLAAAAEAAGGGAKVIILDKMPTYGGNSIINGGEYNSWDDEFHLRQKLNLGDDSPELHKSDTLKGGDFYGSPELVDVLVNGATPALNWMIDEGGTKLRNILNRTGGHTAYRTHTCVEGVGRGYTEALKKIAEKRGAKIRLNTKLTWIWRKDADPQSPVEGVEVMTGNKTRNIRIAKALVMASGGFSRDKKMRREFNPGILDEYNCTNHPGATGETIRMAQAIGADSLHLAFIQLYPFAEPESGILDAPAVYPFRGPGYGIVYVNKLGKRFVNEMERRDVVSMAQIRTKMKPTYSIFNEAMIPKMGTKEEVEKGIAKGRFVKADTLAELAGKLGMPAKDLEETISNHNRYMAEGKDPEFGRQFTKVMIPMTQGPFYAIAQWPAVHHTMGGIRINKNAQVIDIWGNVIPRLYAAGEFTGGIHGANRLGGNAAPDAVVFGRVAGINAAKEKGRT
ncbi:MAG: Urocanate reductase precursor [Syntrophus sp. PtaB.Bin001]|nr:MAG: Urocanate reductase precursor [Syntrophus sp. PtaB.Bin001]